MPAITVRYRVLPHSAFRMDSSFSWVATIGTASSSTCSNTQNFPRASMNFQPAFSQYSAYSCASSDGLHSQFPARKTPTFCCHFLQIFCKCITFQILKITKNLFSDFHEIASSQREISSIDTLYFQYIIDTRYCQFLSRTISRIHLQTASVHSHPDCSQFREHPQKLPPF